MLTAFAVWLRKYQKKFKPNLLLSLSTANRSALDIAKEVEMVGGAVNAYTSREVTAYYMKVLKEDIGLSI